MRRIYFAHDTQESPTPRRVALELAGYAVSCFRNGVALLDAIAAQVPDLVVLDVLLEGRNGFEICRTLRQKYSPDELPLILSSPIYRARAYKDEAQALGAQRYLLRPCEPEELLVQVNELLRAGAEQPRDQAA
jgi:DNA-binding response OmpR family regulator